jgi:hypothetical protein
MGVGDGDLFGRVQVGKTSAAARQMAGRAAEGLIVEDILTDPR